MFRNNSKLMKIMIKNCIIDMLIQLFMEIKLKINVNHFFLFESFVEI